MVALFICLLVPILFQLVLLLTVIRQNKVVYYYFNSLANKVVNVSYVMNMTAWHYTGAVTWPDWASTGQRFRLRGRPWYAQPRRRRASVNHRSGTTLWRVWGHGAYKVTLSCPLSSGTNRAAMPVSRHIHAKSSRFRRCHRGYNL